MGLDTHPPASDLWLPRPEAGETWDRHTIHTHYFGFSVPDAAIGVFAYVRYQPAFPLAQGGVIVFRGLDNRQLLDAEYVDYEMTLPWPEVDGGSITTANGLTFDFVEPGRVARMTYAAPDGSCTFDVLQEAVSPLLVRGHVMPGEDDHHDAESQAGGSEQFMHATGELVLHGERFAVDCHAPRDRSWRQVRTERRGAVLSPPVCWTPMWFGEDLVFNQISIEHRDDAPPWADVYDVPAGRPTHHFAWIVVDGEPRAITDVRRTVHERHPELHAATAQEVAATDETGRVHRFRGRAIAMSPMPAWPNVMFCDSVFRWEDADGRTTHSTNQEIWFDRYQRRMARPPG